MAAITGSTGNVSLVGGYVTNVFRWEANFTCDELETTPFSPTLSYRTYSGGLKDWSGSYECYIDGTTPLPSAGVEGEAVLTAASGQTYTGDVVVTGTRLGVSADGSRRTLEVTFEGAGAPTPA